MSQGLLFKNELLSKSKMFGSGGKYDVGDTLTPAKTDLPIPLILQRLYYYANSVYNVVGEDNTYVYVAITPSYIVYINKLTDAAKTSASLGNTLYKVYSNNDGVYFYVLGASFAKKVRISDGTVVWTINFTNTGVNGGDLRVVGNYLYVISKLQTSVYYGYYIVIQLTSETTATKISETQVYYNGSYGADKIYIINDYEFYITSANSTYHYNLQDGTTIETFTPTNSHTVIDVINKIYYSVTSTNITAYKLTDNSQLWNITNPYGTTQAYYVYNTKYLYLFNASAYLYQISINGTVSSKLILPMNAQLEFPNYNFDMDEISCFYMQNVSGTSYSFLSKIIDKFKILN